MVKKTSKTQVYFKKQQTRLMDEQLRIILIILVSVSIFGLLVFVFVKNYIKNKIDYMVKKEKDKSK